MKDIKVNTEFVKFMINKYKCQKNRLQEIKPIEMILKDFQLTWIEDLAELFIEESYTQQLTKSLTNKEINFSLKK